MSWNNHSLSSTKLDGIQNHDDFQIVWFGLDIYISEELINMIEFLHQYFTFDECENYIKSVKNDRSILLVLTDFFDCALDFDRYNQIHSIYILTREKYSIEDYKKIQGIFLVNDNFNSFERTIIQGLENEDLLKFPENCSIETKREIFYINHKLIFLFFVF